MTRRDFLKKLSITAVAVVLSPLEAIATVDTKTLQTKGQITEMYFSNTYIDLSKGNPFFFSGYYDGETFIELNKKSSEDE